MKSLSLLLMALMISSSATFADSAATVEPLPFADFKRIAGERSVTIDLPTKTAILEFIKGMNPVPPQIASVADKLRDNAAAISLEALMPLLNPEWGLAISEKLVEHEDPLVQFVSNLVLTGSGSSEAAGVLHALIYDESLDPTDQRLIRTWCEGVGIRVVNDDATAIFNHLSTAMRGKTKFKKGDASPDFVTKTTQGHDLSSRQFQDQVIVLHFWSTGCAPCLRQMPSHIKTLAQYDPEAVAIVYVSLDQDEKAYDATVSEHNIPFDSVREAEGWGGNLARLFGVNSIPFDIVIGRDGRVFSNSIDDVKAALATEPTPSQNAGKSKP